MCWRHSENRVKKGQLDIRISKVKVMHERPFEFQESGERRVGWHGSG